MGMFSWLFEYHPPIPERHKEMARAFTREMEAMNDADFNTLRIRIEAEAAMLRRTGLSPSEIIQQDEMCVKVYLVNEEAEKRGQPRIEGPLLPSPDQNPERY